MSAAAPPARSRAGLPLARLTTVRTGGRGEFFARAGDAAELLELLAWARRGGARRSAIVGSGSNLLIADEGVRRARPEARRRARARSRSRAGACSAAGGARLPAVAARAARAGLSGHRVRREHPRHARRGGAHERERLRRRAGHGCSSGSSVAGPAGLERRAPADARARLPQLEPRAGRGRRAGVAAARRGRPRRGLGHARGDAPAPPRGPAAGHQDLRLDVQEPRRSARRGAQRRACCSPRPAATGSASAARASRPSTPTSSRTRARRRTADVVAVMAEGRRRVLERTGVELEPEVQTLGDVRFPWRR